MKPIVAVAVGTLVVNVPVVAIMIGTAILAFRSGLGIAPTLILAFLLGWLWWSLCVPRWRLWAYRRVASTSALQRWALGVGLVWPRGSLPERTEIKSAAHRLLEKELEQQFP